MSLNWTEVECARAVIDIGEEVSYTIEFCRLSNFIGSLLWKPDFLSILCFYWVKSTEVL